MISNNKSNFNIEKINTFNALVENNNDQIAFKYLDLAEWDEIVFF